MVFISHHLLGQRDFRRFRGSSLGHAQAMEDGEAGGQGSGCPCSASGYADSHWRWPSCWPRVAGSRVENPPSATASGEFFCKEGEATLQEAATKPASTRLLFLFPTPLTCDAPLTRAKGFGSGLPPTRRCRSRPSPQAEMAGKEDAGCI